MLHWHESWNTYWSHCHSSFTIIRNSQNNWKIVKRIVDPRRWRVHSSTMDKVDDERRYMWQVQFMSYISDASCDTDHVIWIVLSNGVILRLDVRCICQYAFWMYRSRISSCSWKWSTFCRLDIKEKKGHLRNMRSTEKVIFLRDMRERALYRANSTRGRKSAILCKLDASQILETQFRRNSSQKRTSAFVCIVWWVPDHSISNKSQFLGTLLRSERLHIIEDRLVTSFFRMEIVDELCVEKMDTRSKTTRKL